MGCDCGVVAIETIYVVEKSLFLEKCLFGSFSTLWHGTIRAFYPRLQASHLCCGGRMNACTRKGNDPPPYPNNNRPASSKRRAQWQRFSNYARSAECPMLELGRAAIRRQRNDSFLTSILSTPDINATTLAASRRIPFLQYLDARRTVLLIGRKPRSSGVSNGRAIKNMKAIVVRHASCIAHCLVNSSITSSHQ